MSSGHVEAPSMLDHIVGGSQAWVGADIQNADWFFRLSAQCLLEIRAAVAKLRRDSLPIERLTLGQFDMPACRDLMRSVRAALDEGVRFAVVDRLPLDELSDDEARALHWLLSSHIARPVAQKLDGTMIYDVHDTGRKATPGSGVRPDKTNMDQYFHNDNSYNETQPEYVGLLCVRPAKAGGISHVISFYTVHNELLHSHKQVLPRLYRPFWFDRQGEYLSGEPPVISGPLFRYDGKLRARLSLHTIEGGHALMNEAIDEEGAVAIEALKRVLANTALSFRFEFERGQLQYVNNLELCHRRTGFEDYQEPQRKRLLVRVWLRDVGEMRYQG
jgi:alpha-ketoglutarate-dependent taurine dioxygenase